MTATVQLDGIAAASHQRIYEDLLFERNHLLAVLQAMREDAEKANKANKATFEEWERGLVWMPGVRDSAFIHALGQAWEAGRGSLQNPVQGCIEPSKADPVEWAKDYAFHEGDKWPLR